jgi:hypothetical protein
MDAFAAALSPSVVDQVGKEGWQCSRKGEKGREEGWGATYETGAMY